MKPENDPKPNLIASVLDSRCPRCRRGHLYVHRNPYHLKGLTDMHDNCPVCGQKTDMEVGFWYGTSYVSYALAVAISVATLIAWWVFVGLSLEDNRFFQWMGANALFLVLLQPPLMRLSRMIWFYFFVRYSPRWKEGDIVKNF